MCCVSASSRSPGSGAVTETSRTADKHGLAAPAVMPAHHRQARNRTDSASTAEEDTFIGILRTSRTMES
jgi:hypothetical protein